MTMEETFDLSPQKRQDVSQRRKEKDHQAVSFFPGRSHFSSREDDALLAHRNP